VTGHRDVPVDNPDLRLVVAEELARLVGELGPANLTVVSCLAEGADRLVAEVALDGFDADLVVPLPFAPDEYEKDFETAQSRREFRRLLARCTRSLVVGDGLRGVRDRSDHYAAAGAWLVANCDVLMALWDGRPARGVGGTGELVQWVREGMVPQRHQVAACADDAIAGAVVHVHPQTFEVERLLRTEQ
jgi:hypothetical protein